MSMMPSLASDPEIDHAADHEDAGHEIEEGTAEYRQEQRVVCRFDIVDGTRSEDHGADHERQGAEYQGRHAPFARQRANLQEHAGALPNDIGKAGQHAGEVAAGLALDADRHDDVVEVLDLHAVAEILQCRAHLETVGHLVDHDAELGAHGVAHLHRAEEHTYELQSLLRNSDAV